MKEFFLASVYSLIFAGGMTVMLRMQVSSPAKQLMKLQLGLAIILFFNHLLCSDNLGFLPEDGLGDSFINTLTCVFFFVASVSGGWMQLYNLADRGFSLRVMIDILESGDTPLNVEEVANRYASGKGLGWMYEKRLAGLQNLGLINIEDDKMSLSEKGIKYAKICQLLRRFYSFEDEHEFKKEES